MAAIPVVDLPTPEVNLQSKSQARNEGGEQRRTVDDSHGVWVMTNLKASIVVERVADPTLSITVVLKLVNGKDSNFPITFSDSNGLKISCSARELPWGRWQACIISSVLFGLRKAFISGTINSYGDYTVIIDGASGVDGDDTGEEGLAFAIAEGIFRLLGMSNCSAGDSWRVIVSNLETE